MKNICSWFACLSSFFAAVPAMAQESAQTEATQLKRQVSVRTYEVFDKRRLRLFVSVDEYDSEGRYLLNTLDARSFKLFAKDESDAPVDVVSLSTIATRSPSVLRETAVIFESNIELPQSQSEAIRKAVASFLGGYRSDVLSVRMGNEDTSTRLAWVSPTQSENPRAIQKSVLDAPVLAGTRGLTPAVCSGIRDLNVINDQNGTNQIQRSVVIISSDMQGIGKGFSELGRCLSEARKIGARIFWIRLKGSAAVGETGEGVPSQFSKILNNSVIASGGFSTTVSGQADPLPALNNMRSYLDDEYVLEFDLNRLKPYSDVIELELTANYHGHVLRSGAFKAEGFYALPTPEEIARRLKMQEAAKRKDMMVWLAIVGILSATGVLFWVRLKKKAHVCGDCNFVVDRNFQDCPFRNSKCYGRLSVIHGPQLGKVFPLFSGENTLGTKRSSMIRLKGRGVVREHAKITLSKRKALFSPLKGSESRINGVFAREPRLLGSGSVIRIGESICRVDFKEGE